MDGLFSSLVAGLVVAASVGMQQEGARYAAPSRGEFDRAVTFPYVAGRQRAAVIRKGSSSLRPCMPELVVRRLIGSPDFGMTSYMKGSKPAKPWVTLWYYYLSKPAQSDGDSDSYILVILDAKQRLRSVSAHAVEGIQGIDGSRAKACE
jgi:hypothetical protein